MTRIRLALLVPAFLLLIPTSAQAKTPWVKKAQELGFTNIQNCQACHGRLPTLNDLGQWLVDEKTKRKAEQIDLAWLKDYPKS